MGEKRLFRGTLARALAAVLVGAAALAGAGCKTTGNAAAQKPAENELAARIKKITYTAENNQSIVKVYGSRKFEYTAYKLADPLRLAVEIPGAALDFEPRRIAVDGKIISNMTVVRFPKVNSVRLELELLSDAPFKLTQKPDYLEVQLSEGAAAAPPRVAPPSSPAAADKGAGDLELLRTENENLRAESLAIRKETIRLEEENQRLKKELGESAKQMEEANALSRSLQARVTFMEEQVSGLQAKVGNAADGSPSGGSSIALGAPSAVAVPVPLPAPIAAPAAAAHKPDDEQAKMAVNQTVAAWLGAWRNKNIGKYASFYAPEFRAQDMERDAWIADKKAKFSSSRKFSIAADNVKIGIGPDGGATVVFEQTYKTGAYKDRGLKQLRLRNQDGNWLIVSEEWSPL
ncbi:MAG: AMIN domain-containing protein [Nitrospinae bacterium]|nr:AMIN domain-containing protein [Nitrospinota bacterium]